MGYREVGRSLARAVMRSEALRSRVRFATLGGGVPEAVWRRLPGPDEVPITLSGREVRWVAGRHDSVGRELYWRGVRAKEGATLVPFLSLAAGAKSVLDVGANTGLYTLAACAASPVVRVVAVEPVPETASALRQNLELNGWSDRATVVEAAVGSSRGTAKFHVPEGRWPTSASLDPAGFRGQPGRLIEVPVLTIDEIAPRPLDILKLDVEGFEDAALRGSGNVLSEDQPAIFVECNNDGPADAINELLQARGYRSYALRSTGPEPVAEIVPDEAEMYRNFLALPR